MSKRIKIAVTGVGGGVGQSIIKSLGKTDYQIIGMDADLLGTGLYATPSSYLIPYANSPEYIPQLLKICKKEKCKLLFPGLDAELKILSFSLISIILLLVDSGPKPNEGIVEQK